jgi:hypothetical protein
MACSMSKDMGWAPAVDCSHRWRRGHIRPGQSRGDVGQSRLAMQCWMMSSRAVGNGADRWSLAGSVSRSRRRSGYSTPLRTPLHSVVARPSMSRSRVTSVMRLAAAMVRL